MMADKKKIHEFEDQELHQVTGGGPAGGTGLPGHELTHVQQQQTVKKYIGETEKSLSMGVDRKTIASK